MLPSRIDCYELDSSNQGESELMFGELISRSPRVSTTYPERLSRTWGRRSASLTYPS
jgi:hypothetical protein